VPTVNQRDLKIGLLQAETPQPPIGERAAKVPIVGCILSYREVLIGLVRLLARSAARDAVAQWDQVD
jgi:hypothetical protein